MPLNVINAFVCVRTADKTEYGLIKTTQISSVSHLNLEGWSFVCGAAHTKCPVATGLYFGLALTPGITWKHSEKSLKNAKSKYWKSEEY